MIHAGTEAITYQETNCKSYSDRDVGAASNSPRNSIEKALGQNDTKCKNIMKKIKENSTIICLAVNDNVLGHHWEVIQMITN